jgi:hypothetical protein
MINKIVKIDVHLSFIKIYSIFFKSYIPLTLYPRRDSRGISDIPPRRPCFTKIA